MSDLYFNNQEVDTINIDDNAVNDLFYDDISIDIIGEPLPVFKVYSTTFTIPNEYKGKFNLSKYCPVPATNGWVEITINETISSIYKVGFSRTTIVDSYNRTTGIGTIDYGTAVPLYNAETVSASINTPMFLCPIASIKNGAVEV